MQQIRNTLRVRAASVITLSASSLITLDHNQHAREQLLRNRAPKGYNALPGMRCDSSGCKPAGLGSVAARNPQVQGVAVMVMVA